MNQPITMPALSDTMNNGRLVRWVKKLGDPIKKGETVAEVETDKAVMDVEAFHEGFLAGPLAGENTEMPVGTVIGYISDGATAEIAVASATPPTPKPTASVSNASPKGAAEPQHPAPASTLTLKAQASPASAQPISKTMASKPAHASEHAGAVRASPYARRLAQELGVDVRQVVSGQGDVHAAAVLDAARRPPMPDLAAGPPYRIERASGVREAVARNMIASLGTPTFRVSARLALAPLIAISKEARISLTLLLARACALSVKTHSLFNAVYTPDGLALRERVDVAIAVDTPDGLIAPVIRDVAARPLAQLSADWQAIHERAISRHLSAQDYQGATFYLSNLGMFPVVHSFDAVLPLGAAAILCVAAADGERASFTLGCDHRVLAGADAARFLQTLADWVANPPRLMEVSPASS